MNIRTFKPAYFVKRVRQFAFEKRHPDAPWLTPSAVLFLESYLKPADVGFEWGSGRSTVWFARRLGKLVSVEDSRQWYATVRGQLAEAQVSRKVDYQYIPCECQERDEPAEHPYASAARAMADASLEFALVDGNIRAACMGAILPKIKAGGLLILDNAERYLPNDQPGQHTTVHQRRSAPSTPAWARLREMLQDWRCINTTNGIWETRFWIKPVEPCSSRRS